MVPAQEQSAIWREVANRTYRGTPGARLRPTGEDAALAAECAVLRTGFVHGTFALVRTRDLPPARTADGERTDLPLGADDGLDYSSHWIWEDFSGLIPERQAADPAPFGVLVWEINHHAPRVPAFQDYLNQMFAGRWRISIAPILAHDVFETLERDGSVGPVVVRLGRGPGMPLPLRGFARLLPEHVDELGSLEVVLRPRRGRRLHMDDLRAQLDEWAHTDAVDRLTVTTMRGQVLDLLQAKMRYKRDVQAALTRSRQVDPQAMFQELHNVLAAERRNIAAQFGRVP